MPALIAALLVLSLLTGQTRSLDVSTLKAVSGVLVVILVVGAVGLVVARHQPRNPIGWLLLCAANWVPLSILAGAYATYVYHSGHRGIPLLSPLALILAQLFTLVVAVFPLVTLLFPDGRLPSASWRWVLAAYLLLCLSLPGESPSRRPSPRITWMSRPAGRSPPRTARHPGWRSCSSARSCWPGSARSGARSAAGGARRESGASS